MKKIDIMATLGPASEARDTIKELIVSGATCIRLNFSHGNHEYFKQLIDTVRSIEQETGIKVTIMQDLRGAKLRVGNISSAVKLDIGQKVKLVPEGCLEGIPVSDATIFAHVSAGGIVTMDDGTLKLELTHIGEDYAEAQVISGGELLSRKGLNIPGINRILPALSEKDIDDLLFGIENQVDLVMLSFVREAKDVELLKAKIKELGGKQKVYAKIETEAAVSNAQDICQQADGIVIARGDLGAEIGLIRVPVVQYALVQLAKGFNKPIFIASELMDSMNRSPVPTRAEVNDVATAVAQGATGLIISDETAVGSYPVETIAMLRQICDHTNAALEAAVLTPWQG